MPMPILSRFLPLSFALALASIVSSTAAAQTPVLDAVKKGDAAKTKETKPGATDGHALNAERISRLQLTMQQDRGARDKLKVAVDKLNDDVRKASGSVADMQGQLQTKTKRLSAVDPKSDEAQTLGGEINELTIYH